MKISSPKLQSVLVSPRIAKLSFALKGGDGEACALLRAENQLTICLHAAETAGVIFKSNIWW